MSSEHQTASLKNSDRARATQVKLIERAQAALAEARKNGTVEVITTKDGTQFLSVKMKPES
ncbi:hypothetical protein WB66_04205 [bacteria symbiont BFo1 of Frankliniella occidentalis]|jgi:hypothetical protein|uniref:Uncharacterized protein n=1 Tax=Erwinia aphidicola TaxID=68334 RepID=A0ABU8DCB5_ERWAP|nr:hypothetical protein [Erwinia aphidicola]KMV72148.1 hypothetical protein AI28_14565 [bacteria symbiont BFo1 of Frankliniella occidentalis]KYP86317.1 hypothetical protein WB66_04205 [bacteria symbiont BFo1 of Frankliniella occidentalis]KYP91623.1 hypothetical protein WB91_04165 [bacteria symbiont BFo1 of Frankliniella occidentalis]MBD1374951.1 hypothetical protein [Erwinia aphidicola]